MASGTARGRGNSLRNWTATEDDRCRSLSHWGLLMPLYLSPMLYYKAVSTSCLYCLLLVLLMWALNTAPKPAIAFLHMVNLPLLNIMGAEELAAQYLNLDALLLVVLLYLVALVDMLTDLVPRIAYTGCSRYGLRRNGVFLSLCGATFVGAMLISTAVLCVPLLYLVDRVFSVIYQEGMDQRLNDSPTGRPSPAIGSAERHDADGLFERLSTSNKTPDGGKPAETEGSDNLPINKPIVAAPKKDDQAEAPRSTETEVAQAQVTAGDNAPKTKRDEAAASPHGHHRSKHGRPRSRKRSKKADPPPDAEEPRSSDAVPSATRNGETLPLSPADPAATSPNNASKEGTHNGGSNRRGRKGAGGKKHLKGRKRTADEGPGTQGILKSPEEGVKVPSNEAVPQPPTESAIEAAVEDKPSGARRTLVIQEDVSVLAASKERKATELRLQEESSLSPAAMAQRRASILRQPGTLPRFTATTRVLGRRASVVDFGADEYAAYEPGDVVTKPRILSDTSGSTQSVSQAPETKGDSLISLRRQSRDQPCPRRSSSTYDIHNAFLMGPSLMMMLGSLCSYWTGPSAEAFSELAKNAASPEPDMTASSWCVLTLPGCVAALLLAYFYLSWVHVLPYEPDDSNMEHSAAVQNALTKLKALGAPSLAGALIVHGAVLALVMCVPAGLTLLTLLTWTALLVSAFGSLLAKTAVTVRDAWCRMPWGVIIVLGAVQVATRVVEEYDLLPQLFTMFKPSFWTARSHVEVQAILATISSVLAEATNNRTLSMLMMPIVQDIAETKNMYPMYYAIPVVVGASSNLIMPVSIPMVVMHDVARVPFVRLVRTRPSFSRVVAAM
ncbi:hypothetical protein MTO96_015370 [Rhipicephalus appendiculatus]